MCGIPPLKSCLGPTHFRPKNIIPLSAVEITATRGHSMPSKQVINFLIKRNLLVWAKLADRDLKSQKIKNCSLYLALKIVLSQQGDAQRLKKKKSTSLSFLGLEERNAHKINRSLSSKEKWQTDHKIFFTFGFNWIKPKDC